MQPAVADAAWGSGHWTPAPQRRRAEEAVLGTGLETLLK